MKGKLFKSFLLLLLLTATVTNVIQFIPLSFAYPGTNVYIEPALVDRYTDATSVGDTFVVDLKFGNFTNLAGIEYKVYWNNSVLNLVGIVDTLPWVGPFIATNVTDNNWSADYGRSYFVAVDVSGTPYTGSAQLRRMTFNITDTPPVGYGNYLYSLIDVAETVFGDNLANPIPHTIYDGEFYFVRTLGYGVNVISNSTIEDFQYFDFNGTIKITVSNMTADQTHGYCRLTIPHDVLSPPYDITVNGTVVQYTTVSENETLSIIYFSYEHSTLEIIVIPEFPSLLILPLFMIATLLASMLYRKHRLKL